MKKKNLKNYSIQIIVILFVQLSIVSNLHPSYACTFPYDIGNGATFANAAFSNTLNNCYGGLIVSGSITGQTLSLSGLFKVNSNLTLNSCRIECNPGSGIEIMPGYTLTINNATYFTSCSGTGAMWAGIQVDGTSPGANLVVNNGIFEDAESAIYTLLSQNTFNITVDHAYFNRCCIWVEDNSPTVTPLNLTFFVRNNSVTGFRRCIDLIGLLRMQTKDNLNLQPVDVNLSCGIRELNCSYCSLFNNNVIGITSDLGNSRTVGYWIQTSSKCGTSCNAVSNVQRGFFYSGNSPDHSFVYNTMGACIDQFYLNSVTTGLHICNPGYPANNWFQTNSTCSGVHNTTGANSNIGGAHTYFWHNPPVGGPPINNMNTGIACQFPTTYMYLNQSPCGGNGSGGETSNRDLIDIASDSINWVPGTEEDRYAAMRYVYEILVNDSLLLDSLLSVHTKYDSLSNTNIARLEAVCRLISRLPLAYDSAQVAVIRNIITALLLQMSRKSI